ncbi:MAG: PEP-CTERM sorting domain-containing protein, partial [Fimbriimonadales bacterium]
QKEAEMKATLIVLSLVVVVAPAYSQWVDNFDRSNSPDLGSNWTAVVPSIGIRDNMATNPEDTFGLSLYNGGLDHDKDFYLFARASAEGRPNYVALAIDYLDESRGVFIKIGDLQGDGFFDQIELRQGNNGALLDFGIFQFDTPVQDQTIGACFHNGRLVTMVPMAGIFLYSDLTGLEVGDQTGIGISGGAMADNFDNTIIPEPSGGLGMAVALSALWLARRRR